MLHEAIREKQFCILFRNNHFSTLFKYQGELYSLITDAGYRRETSIVWEKLNQVDNDTVFCDSSFHIYHPKQESSVPSLLQEDMKNLEISGFSEKEISDQINIERKIQEQKKKKEEERDFQVALAIQQEEVQRQHNQPQSQSQPKRNPQQPRNQRQPSQHSEKSQENCDIL